MSRAESRLRLTPEHLQDIHDHASRTYPEECCGVLMGHVRQETGGGGAAAGAVERSVALENERRDSRHNRYVIEPETVLQAHRQARELELEILGYYHSHPDHPAVPSEFDREHAWPGMSYLITAVEKGQVVDTRSWRLRDDRSAFDEEPLDVEGTVNIETPTAAASSPQEVAE
jgi:proteasome lid subunit RPN8/RPN11